MIRKILTFAFLIVVLLVLSGCVNNTPAQEEKDSKNTIKEATAIPTITFTPAITSTPTHNPTQTQKIPPTPSTKYKKGDVISASEDPRFGYGWVISKYDEKGDLYYGYRAEFSNGKWKRTPEDMKEWDLWNKEKTEADFPYLRGHIII